MPEESKRLHNNYKEEHLDFFFFFVTEDSIILILENTAIVTWTLVINVLNITQKTGLSKKLTSVRLN